MTGRAGALEHPGRAADAAGLVDRGAERVDERDDEVAWAAVLHDGE
ncbi:MAG: hypothetical protein ACRDOP_08275 [Gaiellaceae bacterium]